ncbi:glycoprotein-N-acetylgalactosamine 3-beta-galactosyltransferase 1-like isoform X4 [Macrobrachium rosenbergii]|uniref:glycoprotein-N-acetylgalactosamine 3-beta-galactosyltransferase 1-like isoform X4 n=2 Tax=Macrobrachium rosenbergii TaxID=79674 RepID=UPI0034D3D80E
MFISKNAFTCISMQCIEQHANVPSSDTVNDQNSFPVAKVHERFQDLHGHNHEDERDIPDNVLTQHDPSELHHKDSVLGAIDLGAGDGRDVLWGKTKRAYKYVYDHHLNEYDWFFKGDDDTYVLMENMRYMLAAYDPTFPIYFGSRFKKFSKQGYMSGGGGYVLSREAVRKFIEDALPNKLKCKEDDTGAEDAEMGKCLDNIGVLAGDSRDSLGRGRFFPFTPATHLMGGVPDWYLDYVYYKPDTGLDCCSDTPVTFHYVSTDLMYTLEYLLYHARPYGIVHHDPYPAPLPPDTKSIPEPILEKQRQKLEALKSKGLQQNDNILTPKVGENVI